MRISIDNSSGKYEDGFFEYLKRFTTRQLILNLNPLKLKKFEEAINQEEELLKPFRKSFSGRDIFYAGANNLNVIKFFDGRVILQVDPNVIYYGTRVKLITLIRFLNYGNGDYKGYPIFTDTFNYVRNNLDAIYQLYERTK
jgi:hypothetical protein